MKMNTRKLTVELDVELAFLSALLSMVADGSQYWATTTVIERNDDNEPSKLRVVEDSAGREEAGPINIKIGYDELLAGFKKIQEPTFKIDPDRRRRLLEGASQNDAGIPDPSDVDCLLQAFVFGELVYG
jgi:hypothetical protein